MSENKKTVEIHGCIVCAKQYNLLAVYTPDGKLVDCSVISPGGQIVPEPHQLLVACATHTTEKIEAAYQRWQSRRVQESANEQEDE